MLNSQRQRKDAESRLIDYVEQLRHHREGRKAVMLRLSQLQPHNRDEKEIEFVHKLVQPLLRNCGGEFFRLQNDDIVFILLMGIDVATIERVVHKLLHTFQEDKFINFGRGPGVKTFCTWFDLDSAYDDFRDAVQRQKQGVPHGPTGRTVEFDGSLKLRRRNEPDEDTNDTLLAEETTPGPNASVDTILGPIPVRALIDIPKIVRVGGPDGDEHTYDVINMPVESLEQYFLPGVDISQNEAFAESITLLSERRLLNGITGVLAECQHPMVMRFRLPTLLSTEFLSFSKTWRDYCAQPLTVAIRHEDVQNNQRDFAYVQNFLNDLEIGVGLHSVSVLDIDPDLVETFSVLLIEVERLTRGGESAQEVMAWLLSMKPPFPDLVLCGASGAENMMRGRELGFTLFEQLPLVGRGYGSYSR